MEHQTTENDAEPEDPLWLRICLRLICGGVTAAILGAICWYYTGKMGMVSGAVFGLLCGIAYGENALMSIFGGWFNASPHR